MNVPRPIAMVMTSGKATPRELQDYYGSQDLYDIIEVLQFEAHNTRVASKTNG